ncbi:MAG: nuclear transport factor 2 family protein [Ginsengibacter sp.]
MKYSLLSLLICIFSAAFSQSEIQKSSISKTKAQLLSLERKWLIAEFALDTAYLSTLLDSTFIGISADHISDKQQELKGMYNNISAMRKDSIFLDSLRLEDEIVNLHNNTAIITFIVHTYKKEKGKPTEKRTRFYDVWIKRNGDWKAVSSQGSAVTK